MPLPDCEEKFGLKPSNFLSDLSTIPKFADTRKPPAMFCDPVVVVVEIDDAEGKQHQWKPGFYVPRRRKPKPEAPHKGHPIRIVARMSRWLSVTVVAAAATVTLLASNARAQDLPVCPLEIAIRNLEDFNVQLDGRLAEKENIIFAQMSEISSKSHDPNLPLKDQLSQADINAFQRLREQILALEGQEIVESGYLRDARVVSEAAKASFTEAQGARIDEHDPSFFYYGIVLLMRVQHPADNIKLTSPNNPKQCNVEAGLHFTEQLALKQLERLDFNTATQSARAIANKYGLNTKEGDWISKIPSIKDRQAAQRDMLTIQTAFRWREHINDLENLKALNRVAILGYLSDSDDLANAQNEAELSKLGTSWPEKVKRYDEWTQFLSGLQITIAKKVPSDAAIKGQGLSNNLKQQRIIQ
jgi:hypothetical protein